MERVERHRLEVHEALPALILLTALGCGKHDPAPAVANDERTTCTSDSDCVITTTTSCCACCPSSPRAMAKREVEKIERRCAVVDCAPCKEKVDCERPASADALVAACKAGTCVSAAKK